MRIDLEQFLALTMALGTAGAIGVAVYTNHEARAEAAQSAQTEPAVEAEEEFPEAPMPEPKAEAPAPAPAPAPMPELNAAPEELDAAPGPQVESMAW